MAGGPEPIYDSIGTHTDTLNQETLAPRLEAASVEHSYNSDIKQRRTSLAAFASLVLLSVAVVVIHDKHRPSLISSHLQANPGCPPFLGNSVIRLKLRHRSVPIGRPFFESDKYALPGVSGFTGYLTSRH